FCRNTGHAGASGAAGMAPAATFWGSICVFRLAVRLINNWRILSPPKPHILSPTQRESAAGSTAPQTLPPAKATSAKDGGKVENVHPAAPVLPRWQRAVLPPTMSAGR